MSFCIAFTSHPLSMNSTASQSRSSGFVRELALRAEVIHGLNDSGAEVGLPEAIHGDSRGERICAIREPARQIEAIARRVAGRQDFRDAGSDFFTWCVISPALQDEGVAIGSVGHGHHSRDGIVEGVALDLRFADFR